MISIVLPVYNGEKYLKESIESVINQSFKDWELIVVNDCSTDNTKKIVEEYIEKDKRIKLINNEKNMKLPKSLNIGFDNARGEYFTWTSDDNIYEKEALEKMLEVLENNKDISLVYADMDIIDERGNFIKNQSYDVEDLFLYDVVGACFLYTRRIAEKTGKYDSDMFLVEDYDYWLRISKNGKIYHLKENLYKYRSHNESLTGTREKDIYNQNTKLRGKEERYILENTPSKNKLDVFFSYYLGSKGKSGEYLESILYKEDEKIERLSFFKRERILYKDKKIILFGAGIYGMKALEFFGKEKVKYFLDNDKNKQGNLLEGKKIISFEEFLKVKDDYNIVISAYPYNRLPSIFSKKLEDNFVYNYFFYQEFLDDMKLMEIKNG